MALETSIQTDFFQVTVSCIESFLKRCPTGNIEEKRLLAWVLDCQCYVIGRYWLFLFYSFQPHFALESNIDLSNWANLKHNKYLLNNTLFISMVIVDENRKVHRWRLNSVLLKKQTLHLGRIQKPVWK